MSNSTYMNEVLSQSYEGIKVELFTSEVIKSTSVLKDIKTTYK